VPLPATHSLCANEIAEEKMRILVSLSGMLRLVALCFVLGIALGVYVGIGDGPDITPPAPVDTSSNVERLAAPN
jgi:hypothetical protein